MVEILPSSIRSWLLHFRSVINQKPVQSCCREFQFWLWRSQWPLMKQMHRICLTWSFAVKGSVPASLAPLSVPLLAFRDAIVCCCLVLSEAQRQTCIYSTHLNSTLLSWSHPNTKTNPVNSRACSRWCSTKRRRHCKRGLGIGVEPSQN